MHCNDRDGIAPSLFTFDGNYRRKPENTMKRAALERENPCAATKNRVLICGGRCRVRTCDPLLVRQEVEDSNFINNNTCDDDKSIWTGQRTVPNTKPPMEPQHENTTHLFSNLAAIVVSWPSVPDPIKTAVQAVLAPYLITEGIE